MILNILNPDIAFDGWAIAIIVFILSCCIGTCIYRAKNKISQIQKSGSDSDQEQTVNPTTIKDDTVITQSQKAGDNSKQKQSI